MFFLYYISSRICHPEEWLSRRKKFLIMYEYFATIISGIHVFIMAMITTIRLMRVSHDNETPR